MIPWDCCDVVIDDEMGGSAKNHKIRKMYSKYALLERRGWKGLTNSLEEGAKRSGEIFSLSHNEILAFVNTMELMSNPGQCGDVEGTRHEFVEAD